MDVLLRKYKEYGRVKARHIYGRGHEGKCSDCGVEGKLDMHHLDGDTHNNRKDNVIFICHVCHLRRERKEGRVGSKTRLSAKDIEEIRQSNLTGVELGKIYGYDSSYMNDIRSGRHVPKPRDTDRVIDVPLGWKPERGQGKARALLVPEVRKILRLPIMSRRMAKALSQEYGVCLATIYKARGRYGCYGDPIYDEEVK